MPLVTIWSAQDGTTLTGLRGLEFVAEAPADEAAADAWAQAFTSDGTVFGRLASTDDETAIRSNRWDRLSWDDTADEVVVAAEATEDELDGARKRWAQATVVGLAVLVPAMARVLVRVADGDPGLTADEQAMIDAIRDNVLPDFYTTADPLAFVPPAIQEAGAIFATYPNLLTPGGS